MPFDLLLVPTTRCTPLPLPLPLPQAVFRFDDPPLHDPCAVAYVIAPELFQVRPLLPLRRLQRRGLTPGLGCAVCACLPLQLACQCSVHRATAARCPCCHRPSATATTAAAAAGRAAAGGRGDRLPPVSGADGGGHLAPEPPAKELHRLHGGPGAWVWQGGGGAGQGGNVHPTSRHPAPLLSLPTGVPLALPPCLPAYPQKMDVPRFYDLLIQAIHTADRRSPLNSKTS